MKTRFVKFVIIIFTLFTCTNLSLAQGLPIGFLSFTGTCDRQHVVLKWSTATETNNDYFSVERSVEGINWRVVGTIGGKGNTSSVQRYTLTDMFPNKHVSYYRLKQTDFNGDYRYGNELAVKNCSGDLLSNLAIYPNPSDGTFELKFTGNINLPIAIEIFNVQGQKIYETPSFQSKFDLSNKPRGIYFMNVKLNSKNINLRFIVN